MSTPLVDVLTKVAVRPNPFPGLRPFDTDESYLFFGRDGQSEEVIDLLAGANFVAVVGTSGSGKSSLVRAGLLPSLRSGLMATAGPEWRIATLRPGSDPIGNLATALQSTDAFGTQNSDNGALQIALTEAVLRRGSRGLLDIVRQNQMPGDANLLVIVDQFEELFRFEREAARRATDEIEQYQNDAAAFVKLLIEACGQKGNIYVALTMRSDYLGDCSQFWGLPEAINESQYLIPRLTRDQMREVITGPIAVHGGEITPRLIARLLNDVGDNQDQLPVLQHLLMRMWNESQELRLTIQIEVEGETVKQAHKDVHQGEAIDLCCYEAVGGMANALSRHADEAYAELPDERHRKVAEKAFKALTEKGSDNREVRRPITVKQICAVARAAEPEVLLVVETFRRPGRSFFMPAAKDELNSDSLIDISHESLIRGWALLKKWVDEEADSVRDYRRLADLAALHKSGKSGLVDDPYLQTTIDWRKDNDPNKDWAERYCPGYEEAMQFLKDSEAARERKRAEAVAAAAKLRRRYNAALVAAVIAFIASFAAVIAYRDAKRATKRAIQEKETVVKLRYMANVNLAYQNLLSGNLARVVQLLNGSLSDSALPGEKGLRGFLWYYLWRSSHNEQATLTGHTGPVDALAFSRDGKLLASASGDKTIKLWDARTRQAVATLSGHTDFVQAIAFSPDGKILASASEDRTVKLWDVDNHVLKEKLALSGNPVNVRALAFSPDGKMLAIGADDETVVRLWDMTAGRELEALKGHTGGIRSLAFSADGKMLASGSNDKTVKFWDVTTSKAIYTSPEQLGGILAIAFSPDDKMVASSINDKLVKLWDVSSLKELASVKEHSDVYSLTFSPDGKILAVSGLDGTVKLRNPKKLDDLVRLSGHSNGVLAVAFSPDGKTLASGSIDTQIKLTDSSAWQASPSVIADSQKIFAISLSPDGQTLAAATYGAFDDKDVPNKNASIKLLSVSSRKEIAVPLRLEDRLFAKSLAFSPDGRTLLAGLSDGSVRLWQTANWNLIEKINAHRFDVNAVAFSPDARSFATASNDQTAKVWDIDNRNQPRLTLQHPQAVVTLAFSPDGKSIATGGYDKILRLWDAKSGQLIFPFPENLRAIISLAFSPDGKTLVAGDYYGNISFWNVETHELLATQLANYGGVLSIAFSPDGRNFVSAGHDNAVRLWDVESRQELTTLTEDPHGVYAVAFSRDGKTLVSAGFDKTIKFWFAASDQDVERQRK